jgi:hypothetical protein
MRTHEFIKSGLRPFTASTYLERSFTLVKKSYSLMPNSSYSQENSDQNGSNLTSFLLVSDQNESLEMEPSKSVNSAMLQNLLSWTARDWNRSLNLPIQIWLRHPLPSILPKLIAPGRWRKTQRLMGGSPSFLKNLKPFFWHHCALKVHPLRQPTPPQMLASEIRNRPQNSSRPIHSQKYLS